ncbi:uncharacterized protein LOC128213126 [Mya arenaria]|uniref:uncharacterized protein LOC128213126 n=1 Tax=Mya arenaria TaxID=6604 RepID=UPI0022E0F50D|nr:uncharacterized protein LOC128213126 [Mya arenaria]
MENGRRWCKNGVFILLLLRLIDFSTCQKIATVSCNEVAGSPNIVRIIFRIVLNSDPVFKVYGFDAAVGDTSLSANRIDACVADGASVDTVEITTDVDVTSGTPPCGASVSDMGTYYVVSQLFRVYAYSDTLLTVDDSSYSLQCRSDLLEGTTLNVDEIDASTLPVIVVQPPQTGAYLRIRDSSTLRPLSAVAVGDMAFLSVEFSPAIEQGPDNYGTKFYVGFLGNDVISGTSSSQLFLHIRPRYNIRTDVTVTTSVGHTDYEFTDGSPQTVSFNADFMGCSEGGVAEVAPIGIEVDSYDMEIAVLVCNVEADSADCYTALPADDVTGTEYYTVSMPSANDASEFMVVAQNDATTIDITIPAGISHTVQLDVATYSAGDTFSVTLNKYEAFHLTQTISTSDHAHVTGHHIVSNLPVSVISGNRKYNTDHMAAQLPPSNKAGTHYVITPAIPVSDGRVTSYIVQAVTPGVTTTVKRYTTISAFDTYTLTVGQIPPVIIDVASTSPCEITSDQPIMVVQVVGNPTATQGFEHAMLVVPSVQQWSPTLTAHGPGYGITSAFVLKSSSTHVQLGAATLTLSNSVEVVGPSGFVFGPGIALPADQTYTFTTSDGSTMVAMLYAGDTSPSNIGIAFLPHGIRYSEYNYCFPAGRRGDLLDNDCDGAIDEDNVDNIDNDGDGLVDEDAPAANAAAISIRPVNCRVAGDAAFTSPTTLTGADGCITGNPQPFSPDNDFTAQTGTNIGSGEQHKVLYGGVFQVAMFLDRAQLFFACDIAQYCYTDSDTACTTNICVPGIARKRAVDGQAENITADVEVFPYSPRGAHQNTTVEYRTDASVSACLENAYIAGSLAALLGVTVVAMSVACCFCCLFRGRLDEWRRKDGRRRRSDFHVYTGKSR